MSNNDNIKSGRQLANEYGISEGSIRLAYNRDLLFRIKLGKNRGKYDMSDERNINGINLILSNMQAGDKRPRKNKKQTKQEKKNNIIHNSNDSNIDDNDKENTQEDENKKQYVGIVDLDNMVDIGSLRVLKEREAIREKQLKNREMRGELVDRKNISFVFNKLWSIDSSQLTTLGSKLAPEIASVCKVDDPVIITQIRKKIDDEIYKTLGHCKRLLTECLGKIGADNLEEDNE